MRNIVPLNECPAGKAIAWTWTYAGSHKARIYGPVLYETLEEALADAGPLLLESKGKGVIVNYKATDESSITIYEFKHIATYPRREPWEWSKSCFNPKNWFK